jgi:hypothetical protein
LEVRKYGKADNMQHVQKGLVRFKRNYIESWLALGGTKPGISIGVFVPSISIAVFMCLV